MQETRLHWKTEEKPGVIKLEDTSDKPESGFYLDLETRGKENN